MEKAVVETGLFSRGEAAKLSSPPSKRHFFGHFLALVLQLDGRQDVRVCI